MRIAEDANNSMTAEHHDMRRSTDKSAEFQALPESRIGMQVNAFVDLLEGFNGKLPEALQRCPEDYKYLRTFFVDFVNDRDNRAHEVNTERYGKVVEVAERVLPLMPFFVMCMDGRVKAIHEFGFSARIGGAIRVPGGLLKEFYRGNTGELVLDGDSSFAELLAEALARNNGSLAEVFDSHWGCAARKGEEASKGRNLEDAGFYNDILHKKEMVQATRKFILEQYGDTVQAELIQTQFNPITGYMYMGLETDDAMLFAKKFAEQKAEPSDKANTVYSKEALEALIKEGLIISTGALIDHPLVKKVLSEHFFAVDWRNQYVNTAENFWANLEQMKDSLLPIFESVLTRIYPELGIKNNKTRKELEERAMLLMCNMYNTYLHNPDHNEFDYLSMEDEDYEERHQYEYDSHIEQGIKVSEGGYPPYEIPMFVIFSGDEENMAASIELASGIVRGNRSRDENKHPIKDSTGNYHSQKEFAAAPVAIVMQEIIRDKRLTSEDWEALEKIDWSNLPKDWDTMSQKEFAQYVNKKGKLSGTLVDGIERLRQKMAKIYCRDAVTASHLIEQYKAALPVVCDQDRETHAVIPFVKLGY